MAGRPKAKSKKSQSKSNPKKKKKGPTSPIYGQKHKSLAELHGVDVLSIQIPEFDEPISPRSFITWLGIQGRLNCLCLLHIETHQHLLFECYFRQQLLFTMLRWIGVECRIELCHSGLTGPQEALEDPV